MKIKDVVNNPLLYRLFLWRKLPLTAISKIRVSHLNDASCVTTVKSGWLTNNPFKSMYFAVQAMAAELSTGLLCLHHVQQHQLNAGTLITKMESEYHKKAIGKIHFLCEIPDGFDSALSKMHENKNAACVFAFNVIAKDEFQDVVSTFSFEWSIKLRS